jgi:hypothetical protein
MNLSVRGATRATRHSLKASSLAAIALTLSFSLPWLGASTTQPLADKAPQYELMTWVWPNEVDTWKASLTSTWGGSHNPGDTITRLGAQAFNARADGSILQTLSESDLDWARKYCADRGIEYVLCVTDYGRDDFDWGIAKAVFGKGRAAFMDNILRLVKEKGADGVDIDFEGYDDGEADRGPFSSFIRELSSSLHARGKSISVDVFPSADCEPNIEWIADWADCVDLVNSMGYGDLCGGGGDADWKSYAWQQSKALASGLMSYEFAIGMDGGSSAYGQGGLGRGILDHVKELRSGRFNRLPSSVCVWDARFLGAAWRTPAVWEELYALTRTAVPD